VGGVLLVGARGTAKTTAVRGLLDLMPVVERSTCEYGCEPEDLYQYGMDGVCKECAQKLGMGDSITVQEPMRLVELPLNARLEDVVGGINERIALEQQQVVLQQGILAQADQNLLYIDEVNLLDRMIVDAILDAAAQGHYTVRRGAMAATYRSRITLVGSMNPEEGQLRPQIQDRFGLRVLVRGVKELEDRLEIYQRARDYYSKPYKFVTDWTADTEAAAVEISEARRRLPKVAFAQGIQAEGLRWIQELKIDSHRAEMTLFEAGRAFAAIDDRLEVTLEDLRTVAPMALRQRQTDFGTRYFAGQEEEDRQIQAIVTGGKKKTGRKARSAPVTSSTKASAFNGQGQPGGQATEPAAARTEEKKRP
jgi:magnesium chelatase subunit I